MMRRVFCGGLLAASLLLAGCGGSGTDPNETAPTRGGRVSVSISWPQPSRLIPIAARGVRLEVMKGQQVLATKVAVAAQGTTTTTMEDVPAGDLTLRASAMPVVDTSGTVTTASGVPQAIGHAPLKTFPGKTAAVTVTMDSTIATLAVTPARTQVVKDALTTPLVPTAYDAEGRVVLTAPELQFEWTSSNPDVVSISNSGAYNPLAEGTATVSVRDKESGKTGTGTVEVVASLPVDRVTLDPATLTLAPGATGSLAARALDAEGNDLQYGPEKFDWTSSDPTTATVSAAGLVTAVAEGSATITATERETGKSATATLTVQSATAQARGAFLEVHDGTARIAELRADDTFRMLPFGQGQIGGFLGGLPVASHDGQTIFMVKSDSMAWTLPEYRIYAQPAETGIAVPVYRHTYSLSDVHPGRDGNRLAMIKALAPGGNHRLVILDVATGAETIVPVPGTLPLYGLRGVSSNLDRLFVVVRTFPSDPEMLLLDDNGGVVKSFGPVSGALTVGSSGPGDRFVMTVVEGNTRWIRVLDRDGEILSSFTHPLEGQPSHVTFHPRGDRLVYTRLIANNSGGYRRELVEVGLDGTGERVIPTGFENMTLMP